MFVVVADSLELTASSELPDDKLEAAPQTVAVEEDEELGQHSVEVGGGGGGGEIGHQRTTGLLIFHSIGKFGHQSQMNKSSVWL